MHFKPKINLWDESKPYVCQKLFFNLSTSALNLFLFSLIWGFFLKYNLNDSSNVFFHRSQSRRIKDNATTSYLHSVFKISTCLMPMTAFDSNNNPRCPDHKESIHTLWSTNKQKLHELNSLPKIPYHIRVWTSSTICFLTPQTIYTFTISTLRKEKPGN